MRTSTVLALFILVSCSARPVPTNVSPQPGLFAVHGAVKIGNGDAEEGRAVFTKLRCDSCHSVKGKPAGAAHPLPDLPAQPPEAIAALIVQRTDVAPGAMFDPMAMSSAASWMTQKQLADIVAYLRRN